MTLSDWPQAVSADQLIAVYVLLAILVAAVLIVGEVGSYFWDRWRARRSARNVIQFRRPVQSTWSVLKLNVRDRVDESKERYKHWRHGDRLIGDQLIERMKGLR